MKSTTKFRILLTGLIFGVAGSVIECSSGSSATPQPTPAPIGVSLAPNGAQTVDQGQAKQLTATVANDSANKGVKWTLTQNGSDCSPGCGTISPATTLSGTATTYTAPATVNTNVQFNVTAISVADTSKSASDQGTAVPPPGLDNPTQLPPASPGQPYKYQLTETGGVPPYTWSVVSGSLPQGLTLNSGTGVISGTPTAAATVKKGASVIRQSTQDCFTVQVADSGNPPVTNTEQVCINVSAVATVAACGVNPPAGAPTIGTQPKGQSFTLSSTPQTANFGVSATSGDASALQYQWFVGAFGPPVPVLSPIQGETTASYVTPTLTGAFNNLQYVVQVSNDVCFLNSSAAVLTVNENPNGKEIQIPTEEQGKNIVLTRSGFAQYMGCQSSSAVTENSCPGGAQVDWSLALNGQPCSPQCGSVIPQSAPAGTRVTYVAPSGGLDLAGQYLTIVATNDGDSTEFASAPIHVTPCNPGNVGVPGDPMCGEFTFLIQGFDANGKPTSAAGHFTGTGLVNSTITDGVMDFNDANGVDPGVAITSGSYTFDLDGSGNLLTDTSAATGTITLNTSSTTESHQQRNYAFTAYAAGAVSGPTQAWPLIEFEPSQTVIPPATNPAANPANGFQGSGTLWPISLPGPYAFPNSNCSAANPPTKQPFDCNYAFQFRGHFSLDGDVGIVGVFNASFDAKNNCVLSSGPQDNMITNAAGVVQLGAVSGDCGTLTTINNVGVADDANGRGSANMTIKGVSTLFEYYVVPRGPIVFIRMDTKAAGDTLSGVAKVTGLGGTSQFSTLECGGSIIINGQEPHCVMYSAGAQGGNATLTVGQLACGTGTDPQPGNVVCKENVTNGQLTGVLSATLDQVAFGNLNNPALNPCPPATTGNPTPPVCPYSINTTNGEGYICLDPNNTPPPNTTGCPGGITDPHAVVYADGFLLANDSSVATGSLNQQLFFCAAPCSPGPVPFDNNNPGQFAGSTVPSSTSTAPDVTGSFLLAAPASSCPGTDNFDNEALFASGLAPNPFILTPPAPAIKGCFAFDNPADPVITGRGTGNSLAPGPANFIFYEVNPEDVIVMQTDNTNNGGQVLLNLLTQEGPNSFISPSSANFSVGTPGSFTVVATEAQVNPATATLFMHIPSLKAPATLADGTSALPVFLQFSVNEDGTMTLSGTPAASDKGFAYPMLISADYTPTQKQQGCTKGDFCVTQAFVLTVQ